jgi:DNA-binding transcriptional ArsR family regulator
LSKAFKALSNPNRLQLFLNLLSESRVDLAEGKAHNCFLATLLGNLKIGAPTVSHHVKELVNADLIDTQREGKQLSCSINPKMVEALRAVFDPAD